MRKILLALAVMAALLFVSMSTADEGSKVTTLSATYQGKTVQWWAKRAVQARKDANARGQTLLRLKKTVAHSPTITECVRLATIAYPAFTERRAWQIINHESNGNPFAKNPSSTASGLYQFLTSTFASTPYGRMSIWSPCASSLAAGWMHQNGRGREWAIGSGISGG
jgi:hypothetical protein